MTTITYDLKGKVWLYAGQAAWNFVTLPKPQAKEIRDLFGEVARGWGSLRITVTLGETTWKTSIFPDKKSGSYVLPIKAQVRKAESAVVGDVVKFRLEVMG